MRCEDGDCRDELGALGIGSLPHFNTMPLKPSAFTAFATPASVLPASLDSVLAAAFEVLQQTAPLFTAAPELDHN